MAIRGFGLFVAFGLSLASLACILLLNFGGELPSSKVFDNLFFFQLDLTTFFNNEPDGSSRGIIPSVTNFTSGIVPGMSNDDQVLAEALWNSRRVGDLKQFYSVYLWRWCSSDASVVDDTAFCSASSSTFEFNPVTTLGLTTWVGNKSSDQIYPTVLNDALNTYDNASRWLRAAYIVAGITKAIELVLGLIAIFSQWGSLITAFAAGISSFAILVASASETAIFGILVAAWNESTGSIGVNAHLGQGAMVLAWFAVALSFGGSFWWFLTVCCSNHRSGPGRGRRRNWVPSGQPIRGHRYENVEGEKNGLVQPSLAVPGAEDNTLGPDGSLLYGSSHRRSVSETGYERFRHQEIGA